MNTTQFIAMKVKENRERLGFGVTELARKSELTRNYIYQVESGEVNISIHNLEAICNALNIHIIDVLPIKEEYIQKKISPFKDKELTLGIIDELEKVKSERDLQLCLDLLRSMNTN